MDWLDRLVWRKVAMLVVISLVCCIRARKCSGLPNLPDVCQPHPIGEVVDRKGNQKDQGQYQSPRGLVLPILFGDGIGWSGRLFVPGRHGSFDARTEEDGGYDEQDVHEQTGHRDHATDTHDAQHGVSARIEARGEPACAMALEMQVPTYQFVRRYLERQPTLPLSLKQVDPLIRELTHYRDLIDRRLEGDVHEHD